MWHLTFQLYCLLKYLNILGCGRIFAFYWNISVCQLWWFPRNWKTDLHITSCHHSNRHRYNICSIFYMVFITSFAAVFFVILGIIGCVGAYKEQKCLLGMVRLNYSCIFILNHWSLWFVLVFHSVGHHSVEYDCCGHHRLCCKVSRSETISSLYWLSSLSLCIYFFHLYNCHCFNDSILFTFSESK